MISINLTEVEREYILDQILLSKQSLDDICDDRVVRPDVTEWFSQEEADSEYKIIDSIIAKLQ